MKIRSKTQYQFLLQRGVLSGPAEAIARAKAEYRRLYKKQWKKRRHQGKELRITFTGKQFDAIRSRAKACGLKHAPYARKAILTYLETGGRPLPEDTLLGVLQLLSMANIALSKQPAGSAEITDRLAEAERLLLETVRAYI